MITKNEKLFAQVIESFQEQYPYRNIEYKWNFDRWIISIDGEDKFTTLGYNLLQNLTKLCELLKNELE